MQRSDDLNSIADELLPVAQKYGHDSGEIRAAIDKSSLRELAQAEYLQRHVIRRFPVKVRPAPLFVWWVDNSEYWATDLQDAFGGVPEIDPKRCGPVIVLSLARVGYEFLEATKQPLFYVRIR